MQETKQKYRYYKILDLPVDTVVAKKDGLEITLEEVDIDTLLAEEREKIKEEIVEMIGKINNQEEVEPKNMEWSIGYCQALQDIITLITKDK